MSDYDARLVDLYDGDNPDGPDHDFYRALADEHDAASILDLGCGTGILTVTFAREDRRVVGVDPSPAMLRYARARSGAARVQWILGDSRDIPQESYDYAAMTGNVAQHIPEPDWTRTLTDLRGRMRRGGVLAFESRNPAVRAWEHWATARASVRDTTHGQVEEWTEVAELSDGVVDARFHSRFLATGDTVIEKVRFAFRDRETLQSQLDAAGFDVVAVHGGWGRGPATDDSPLLVVVAHAR